ncbi:hypothetical protein NAT50_10165 [Flavobacterium sp. HXWNR70]|uniref:Gliding motility-associated protein GldM C-terminal domain-containing protein n=2 Tax=Flavobacterium luminosum TaxID=2949086 RepID=A0ABT0TQF1_9FLAO|nr:hypothetical protein [Flavobacterium sp. HXWNR70]
MKKSFFMISLLVAFVSFGQEKSVKVVGLTITNPETTIQSDSIKIVYQNETKQNKKPAYFINGKLVNESILRTLNPNEISSVAVEKGEVVINNVTYYGKLKIETKNNYLPKPITLNDLKAKYLKLKEKQTIFKIDDAIINADYNTYVVDENYILKIIIETFENKDEKLKLNIVTLLTKSEKNIKNAKEIIIRGNDEFSIIKN